MKFQKHPADAGTMNIVLLVQMQMAQTCYHISTIKIVHHSISIPHSQNVPQINYQRVAPDGTLSWSHFLPVTSLDSILHYKQHKIVSTQRDEERRC